MSQDWTTNLYTTATEADTTLTNMELMFATLKSAFSGATAPASQVPGQIWYDTTKKACKQRNQGDTAWVGLMHGDTSQKIWVYRNAAMDGWAIDSSVTDRVLALKGGTTYTTGAATAGSWTISGLSASHNHQWYVNNADASNHETYDSGGTEVSVGVTAENPNSRWSITPGQGTGARWNMDAYTSNAGAAVSDATWRAAAAVGTLQYLDL